MSNLPDFSSQNYQIERELGQNRACGRLTYLASRRNSSDNAIAQASDRPEAVVIKQFQFAQLDSNWSDYDAYEREVQLLQQLNHPSIPRYLDSFATPAGFCMVQEYKQAPSLAEPYPWTPQEIKQIAMAVLDVLVYLQSQIPPIIHQDIKPENILVERSQNLKVYLVDFGFARLGSGELTVSSVVKGTPGFMPPEQLFNRQLTEASDLYSLGATLICLLTQTKSTEIGNLIDRNYRINFKPLLPKLNWQFVRWLAKMTDPNPKNRFPNAAAARVALAPIDVVPNAANLATLIRTLQIGTAAAVVGLATLSSASLLGRSAIVLRSENGLRKTWKQVETTVPAIETSGSILQQLLETRQCPNCNLRGANLRGANLGGANLAGADLRGANLKGADLAGSRLSNADLADANLMGANLGNADLRGADLGDANLRSTYLGRANLSSAYLEDAYLENAYLGHANLVGANLEGADLQGAQLGRSQLGRADLESANLRNADLKHANLGSSDLKHADLRHAHLWGTQLGGANLEDANLKGADLEGARLKGAIMPDGTVHP